MTMEIISSDHEKQIAQEKMESKKGGIRTMPFIIGESLIVYMIIYVYVYMLQYLGLCVNFANLSVNIAANETFEKVAGVGLQVNMILYLIYEYHMSSATGTNVLFVWSAISHFMPIIGAFLSDSFLGRFRVISLGTVTSLLVSTHTLIIA